MAEPDTATMICRLSDLDDPGSLSASIATKTGNQGIMLVRRDETIRAYINACPHVGTPLDFAPGRFLNVDKTHILCSTHGALFQIEDGLCVSGPCPGKYLENIDIIVDIDRDEIRLNPKRTVL